jgi:hypothetical protein
MDPSKKRFKKQTSRDDHAAASSGPTASNPEEPNERDREYALADAEWKNLWDATEVIDMDKW